MLLVTISGLAVELVWERDGIRVLVMDSISAASRENAGQVIVTGSHGGVSAGEYACRSGVAAVVCNDAGIGKNEAGIAGLKSIDAQGIAGIAVAHDSACIGDGRDTWENGVISFVNETARAKGVYCGRLVKGEIMALISGRGTTC